MKLRRWHVITGLLGALAGAAALAIASVDAPDEKKGMRSGAASDQTTRPVAKTKEINSHAPRLSRRVARALDGEGMKRAGRIVGRFKSTSGCEVLGAVSPRQPDPGPIYGQVREFLLSTKDVGVAIADGSVVIVAVVC
jgi:hypothetical protein